MKGTVASLGIASSNSDLVIRISIDYFNCLKQLIPFLLLVLATAASAATLAIDGSQTYQTIDGFGVNANHRSWTNNELRPVLDALIDQGGMTLFRVLYDKAD